jgi:antitoxin (DNA-binding transcriptional repressor) of toxin-antitoxin stability system
MTIISLAEMQRDPMGYLHRVEGGEAFRVVRDTTPVAEITPVVANGRYPRPYGLCAGEFWTPAAFDAPLPEGIQKEFEG